MAPRKDDAGPGVAETVRIWTAPPGGGAGGANRDGPADAAVLPMVPVPLDCQVIYGDDERAAGGVATTIARTWTIDDARRCPLCARCTATEGRRGLSAMCLKKFYVRVPLDRAESFGDAAVPEILGGGRPSHQRVHTVA